MCLIVKDHKGEGQLTPRHAPACGRAWYKTVWQTYTKPGSALQDLHAAGETGMATAMPVGVPTKRALNRRLGFQRNC